MNKKKFIIALIGAFVSVVLFEMLWHGFLMKGMYDATLSVWRPEADHDMKYMFASQFLFAAVLTFIYTKVRPHISCKIGVAFGFFSGLLLAMPQLGTYCYLPIPLSISLMWMLASLLKCLSCSVVIAFLYKE